MSVFLEHRHARARWRCCWSTKWATIRWTVQTPVCSSGWSTTASVAAPWSSRPTRATGTDRAPGRRRSPCDRHPRPPAPSLARSQHQWPKLPAARYRRRPQGLIHPLSPTARGPGARALTRGHPDPGAAVPCSRDARAGVAPGCSVAMRCSHNLSDDQIKDRVAARGWRRRGWSKLARHRSSMRPSWRCRRTTTPARKTRRSSPARCPRTGLRDARQPGGRGATPARASGRTTPSRADPSSIPATARGPGARALTRDGQRAHRGRSVARHLVSLEVALAREGGCRLTSVNAYILWLGYGLRNLTHTGQWSEPLAV